MLYLTVTGRNDWASQLANSPSSSFFYPSVGLSWVPTSTWDLGEALSYLKIRGSIASVGMPFPRHLTIPTYEYDATNRVWKDKTHYPIGDLKPERTTTYEVGLDARLWQRISLSASWYQADTKNQTFDPSLPPSSSYTTIYLQTGHVRNTGVELSAGYDNQWRDFRWATNFTYSWNRNEIIELAANAVNPVTGEPLNLNKLDIKGLGKAKYILKEGGTLGDLYTTSDLRFNDNGYIEVDKNGNLLLTDEGDDIYLGSVFPDHNLAWRNDFSWKGINLGVLLRPASAASATPRRRPTWTSTAFRRLRPQHAMPGACGSTAASWSMRRSGTRPSVRSRACRSTTPIRRRTSVCRSCRWATRCPQSGSATRCA